MALFTEYLRRFKRQKWLVFNSTARQIILMRVWHQQTLATVLIALMLAVSAKSVELFRYRYQDRDGAEYEALFETDEQSVGKTVDKEKAEEIAMAWMQVFYSDGP